MPVIPFLPHASTGVNQLKLLGLQVEDKLRTGAPEAYVLTVTGADAGAGKSLTAINLGILLAKKGERRVLIIEGDVWRPSFRKLLQVDPAMPDLVDLLSEGASMTPEQATVSVWASGIDVISIRGETVQPDILTSERFDQLLAHVRSSYDVVILDSPPAYLSEGRMLVKKADGALVVTRAGRTKRSQIEQLLSEIPQERCLGLVLNDARLESRYQKKYTAYYRR
jgi:Mrp family chromosome partitioning ATPase